MKGRLISTLALVALTACGSSSGTNGPPSTVLDGTEHSGVNTGNGLASTSLTMGVARPAGSGTGAVTAQDDAGMQFSISTARASIRRLQLARRAGEDCTGQARGPASCNKTQVSVESPFVADLLSHTLSPPLTSLELPAGDYVDITARFDVAGPGAGLPPADPLRQNALYLSGTFTDLGVVRPFSMALAFNEDARFSSATGFSLAADATQELLMELDVTRWFAKLPITECLRSGDLTLVNGALVIKNNGTDDSGKDDGARQCSDLRNALKDAVKASGQARRTSDDTEH